MRIKEKRNWHSKQRNERKNRPIEWYFCFCIFQYIATIFAVVAVASAVPIEYYGHGAPLLHAAPHAVVAHAPHAAHVVHAEPIVRI